MIVTRLDAAALARVRLSPSPAIEAMTWLAHAAAGTAHPVFGAPGPAARHALRDRDVALVAAFLRAPSRCSYPDLLTPKPAALPAARVWPDQLERMAATRPEEAAAQIAACGEVPAPVRAAVAAGTFARRAAAGMSRFWAAAIAEDWPGMRSRLDADIAVRAATMASGGIGAVLASLHRSIRWTGERLEIGKAHHDCLAQHTGQELVLSPTLLGWPKVLAQLADPADAVLTYPALGVGGDRADRKGTERLLGATRARLLADLAAPRSTTELSDRHTLAPATVSYHLSVLHGSGLVDRRRDGRSVRYQRTTEGDALASVGPGLRLA